jgi:hypothetical protein
VGLFGGKKTYVASTVYNLAGDEADRINFLKTVVISNVLGVSNFSMGDMIQGVYLPGPGISARSFFRWALANYQDMGVPNGNLGGVLEITQAQIEPHLPRPAGHSVVIQAVDTGPADYSWWAEQWMIDNKVELLETEWTADYVDGQIVITQADNSTDSFVPVGMDPAGTYIYVVYSPKAPAPVPPETEPAEGTLLKSIYWFYKKGSGIPELDAAVDAGVNSGEFFPTIPFRYNNQFLSPTYLPAAYELARKAYRKATGRKSYAKIIDKIAENESLGDIDHAFMTYGVCLNVKEKACREYIYRLFKKLADRPGSSGYSLGSLRVKSSGVLMPNSLDMEIRWTSIAKSQGAGLRAGRKRGDYWLEKGGLAAGESVDIVGQTAINIMLGQVGTITIYHQKTATAWEAITVTGLEHYNHIYDGKSVKITAHEALDDADDTGFIVPLHYPTVRDMSLVDSTQMMTAATFIVFNSYKVVKQKWYQTGIFKIFVFIVIVVITVVTMGSGTAPAASIGASIAAAAGVTGVMAAVLAAAVNALVGMIISKIITLVTTEIFGAKWGAIIGAIVSIAVTMGMSSAMSGQSLAATWGNMTSNVSGIMEMTSVLGKGITGYMQASAVQVAGKTANLLESYEKQMKEMNEKMLDLLGNRGIIDPMLLTNVNSEPEYPESPAEFLSRTLLTGSDIANMSHDMLNNFAGYTLSLPGTN